jgi:Domain of unknown function (DUF4282)
LSPVVSRPPSRPGFLTTLFDATFSHLLALRLVRVLYLIALLSIGTYGFIALFLGIGQGGITALLSVFAVPLLALLAIALVRVALEALVVIFRMGEQTDRMSRMLYTLSARPRGRDQTESNGEG